MLKSGGNKMTVTNKSTLGNEQDMWICSWFEDGCLKQNGFRGIALKVVG
jgi:uncharacterized protein YodC (DUF2158 family)